MTLQQKYHYVRYEPALWVRIAARIMQITLLLSGLYQIFFGDFAFGALTLISLVVILSPRLVTPIKQIPIEVQLILFVMAFIQFVVGESHDFYRNVPYFDKFAHYVLPLFIGYLGFLIIYAMHFTGRLKVSTNTMVVLIVLVTLGVGAIWEIYEYVSDMLIYPYIEGWNKFQGNSQEAAITDTMNDLIVDTIGGFCGALLGVFYIAKEKSSSTKNKFGLIKQLSLHFNL